MRKPEHQPSSESLVARRRLTKALGLALALHAPVVLYGRLGEVWQAREGIARAAREQAKSILHERRQEKREYIGKLKEALERGEPIDLGEFYLKTEYLEGRAEKKRMTDSMSRLSTIESEHRSYMDKGTTTQNLQHITAEEGRYSAGYTYLSSILLEKEGNCHARERFSAALVHRLYPEMKMAYQVMKIDGEMHVRTLVKIEGEWHSMEKPDVPLSEADLEGTVLYDKYDYVRHYVGSQGLGSYKSVSTSQPPQSYTRITMTDEYLRLPLPDGISFDDIKNVTKKTSGRRNSAGTGSIGTPVTPSQKADQLDQTSVPFSGEDPIRDAMDVEIYTPDVVEQNRRNSEEGLRLLKTFSSPDDEEVKLTILEVMPRISDACADAYIPIVRMGAKEVQKYCRIDEHTGTYPCSVKVACTECNNFISFERRLKMHMSSNLLEVCFNGDDFEARQEYEDDFELFGTFDSIQRVYEGVGDK